MLRLPATYIERILLNGLLLGVIAFFLATTPFRAVDDLLLFSPDAQTYFDCGSEFFNWSQVGSSEIRPFLYPVFLRITHTIGGATFVVILQLAMWLVTGNLVYYAIRRWTNSYLFAAIGVLLFAANLSLIVYAFHGLTEVITSLGLAFLCYYLSGRRKSAFELGDYFTILTVLSLLTVIKPLFWYPFLGVLVIGLPMVYRQLVRSKRFALRMLLILLPLLIQLTTMEVKYNHFGISKIGSITFDRYLFAQGYGHLEELEHEEALRQVEQMTSGEKRQYMLDHAHYFVYRWRMNMDENVGAIATFLELSPRYKKTSYADYMTDYNTVHRNVYKWFFLGFLLTALLLLFKRKFMSHWPLWLLGAILYYCLFASGISFWQGDRLVIFTLPLWIVLYLQLVNTAIEPLRSKWNKNRNT